MVQKLTAAVAWDELESTAIGTDRFCELAGSEPHEVSQWFEWVRDRIAAEVRDEINPQLEKARRERDEARKTTEPLLQAIGLIAALKPDMEIRVNDPIGMAKEVEAEVSRLRNKAEKSDIATYRMAQTLEDAKARIRELESAIAKPAPKPRRTGGQKVFEAMYPDQEWSSMMPDARTRWTVAASELGIPDDPEPPSDGELLELALDSFSDYDRRLSAVAAEFLRLRAERDGGAA